MVPLGTFVCQRARVSLLGHTQQQQRVYCVLCFTPHLVMLCVNYRTCIIMLIEIRGSRDRICSCVVQQNRPRYTPNPPTPTHPLPHPSPPTHVYTHYHHHYHHHHKPQTPAHSASCYMCLCTPAINEQVDKWKHHQCKLHVILILGPRHDRRYTHTHLYSLIWDVTYKIIQL